MAVQGGPASNVVVDPSRARAGGPALPVAVVTDGRATEGNNAIAVYEAPAGTPVIAGPALPIVVAPAGSRVEAGPAIPVRVVAGSLGGATATPPVNTGLPVISGTAVSGQTLSTTDGTWTGTAPISYTYQWKRGGINIGGATNNTYLLTDSDNGATITVTVTATNAAGSASATSASVSVLAYLLLDRFLTNAGAPLASPRTCEPGPGTLTITDTGNNISIASNQLTIAAGASNWTGTKAVGSALTRAAGLAIAATWKPSNNFHALIGGSSASDSNANGALSAMYFQSGQTINITDNGNGTDAVAAFVAGTTYEIALIYRSTGFFALIQGGAFAIWTLLWVAAAGSANPVPIISNFAAAPVIDNFRALTLGALWGSDYGIATQRLAGARSQGDTFTQTADAIIEWTLTTRPSASVAELRFRKQDASNYWSVQVDSTGAITLYEVVATAPTSRGTAAAAVGATNTRILIIADGSTIRVFTTRTLRITYNSASNFATATAGDLNALGTGGAVSDIITWPRAPSVPNF